MAKISLSRGLFAIVDDADLALVSEYNWHAQRKANGTFYAKTRSRTSSGKIFMHRLLAAAPDGFEVDHINHNTLDNRRCNLRVANRSQNSANRRTVNKHGYRGISPVKNSPTRYRAQIKHHGRSINIGNFATAEEAAKAYDAAAAQLHGEFARLNFAGAA